MVTTPLTPPYPTGIYTTLNYPTSPYIGQAIFDSQLGKFLFYYGSTVGWKPNWKVRWGEIANATLAANQNGITQNTETDITGLSLSWTALNNRLYFIILEGFGSTNTPSPVAINFYITDLVNAHFCDRRWTAVQTASGSQWAMKQMERRVGTGSLIGRKARFNTEAGAVGTVGAGTSLRIMDMGSVGPPTFT